MEWASRPPDLNPIGHVWDVVGRRIRQVRNPPKNLQELGAMLVQLWRRIPQAVFRRIIQSIMETFCRSCERSWRAYALLTCFHQVVTYHFYSLTFP